MSLCVCGSLFPETQVARLIVSVGGHVAHALLLASLNSSRAPGERVKAAGLVQRDAAVFDE